MNQEEKCICGQKMKSHGEYCFLKTNPPQPDESMEEKKKEFYDKWFSEVGRVEALDIADWWLNKLALSHSQTIDKILGEIEKMETQKFLDKRCEVSDFIKLDDIISIIKRMK